MSERDETEKLNAGDILDIMFATCQKHNSTRLSVSSIVQGATSYVRQNHNRFGEPNLRAIPQQVLQGLLDNEIAGEVTLTREGSTILRVFFEGFYVRRIQQRLRDLRKEPDIPLPSSSSIALDVPENLLTSVDVQEGLIDFLERSRENEIEEHDTRIVRLRFNHDVESLLIPHSFHTKDLSLICLQKIRFYLRNERNQSYIRQKMLSFFRSRETLVEQTFNAILTRPDSVLDGIWEPNEFTYYFWIQMTNSVIKDYAEKTEKLVHEQNYIQASVLISILIAYRKSLLQKANDKRSAFKLLDSKLRQEPYLFTTSMILEFSDKNNVPLMKRIDNREIHAYLEHEQTPPEGQRVPHLISLGTGSQQLYIRKDLLFTAFFKQAKEAKAKISSSFISDWGTALHAGVKPFEMTNQLAFEDAITKKLEKIAPTLVHMLDFSLLYFTSREIPLTEQTKAELRKIIDSKKLELKPLSVFFELDRSKLHAESKLLLPVWKTIPGLSQLFRLLQKLFIGFDRDEEAERIAIRERNRVLASKYGNKQAQRKKPTKKSSTQQSKKAKKKPAKTSPKPTEQAENAAIDSGKSEQIKNYKERVQAIANEIKTTLSTGYNSPEEARAAALERWNTLIDARNRKNLTVDVENLAKDQARKILHKRGGGAISQKRIEEISDNLSQQDVFEQIRDRKSLQQFISLTIAKYLG